MRRWFGMALLALCGVAAVAPRAAVAQPAGAGEPAAAGMAAGSGGGNGQDWGPQGCGAEPARPVLDLASRESYNKSADVVNKYEAEAKAWDSCVMKEANTDMNAVSAAAKSRMAVISQGATQIQGRVYAGFGEYTAQFKAAQDRFEHDK